MEPRQREKSHPPSPLHHSVKVPGRRALLQVPQTGTLWKEMPVLHGVSKQVISATLTSELCIIVMLARLVVIYDIIQIFFQFIPQSLTSRPWSLLHAVRYSASSINFRRPLLSLM